MYNSVGAKINTQKKIWLFTKLNLFFKLLFGKSLKLINGIGTGSNTTVYKKKKGKLYLMELIY